MSDFDVLCRVLEEMDPDTYNDLLVRKSARVVRDLSGFTRDGADAVTLFADFILCAIACLLAARRGMRIFITQSAETDFILVDEFGNILVPVNDWEYIPFDGKQYAFEFWNTQMLLRYATALLFTCAVNSDSFRYVYTIGSCLSGDASSDRLDFLPYPYGSRKD